MMKLVVLSCLVAAAAASSLLGAYPYSYAAPLAYGYGVPLAYSAPNYRGPLSLAPGQPANILGADGRPLDTLDVNLDRSAHFAAKTGIHLLKKRSAVFAPAYNRIAYTAPLAYSAHYAPAIAPAIVPATYAHYPYAAASYAHALY